MDLSWSQTPNSVWWALENSTSLTDLGSLPTSPRRYRLGVGHELLSNNFYDYADELSPEEEDEEQLAEWIREHPSRGVVRVYQPGSSYSELVRCTTETTAETVMVRCLAKELFVHYGSMVMRRVQLDEFPLQLQNQFLKGLGHSNPHRIQLEGTKNDLSALIKFVAGQERGNRAEDQVQLACSLRVRELTGFGLWSRRFCVLCGARVFMFPSSRPKGKPSLALDLTGGSINEHRSKKHLYCVKVAASRREVLLAFESRLEQSKWLERAAKVVSKHPLEANLASCNLEKIPKYYFLNSNLVAINLAHNFMQESFEYTDAAILGQPRTIGWISDLVIFHHLTSLSLSDNALGQFPSSLCLLSALQELDLSCNSIRVLPQEIAHLSNLTTLLLHSNQLTDLPHRLSELRLLSTLVIAFNKFFELPRVVKELPALIIFVASGNYISTIPEDVQGMQALMHFDLRLNRLKSRLPQAMGELRNLVRFNVRGSGLTEIDTRRLLHLELLNCADNALRSLTISEGPLRLLVAKNNKITRFTVAPTCDLLTSIDISRNELTALPEAVSALECLEKLIVSNNKLTKLPIGIFKMPKLCVLRVASNRLVSLPSTIADSSPLQQLDLHGNQISTLPPQLLIKTNNLQVLNLSSNCLSSLPSLHPREENNNVTELYASNNRLREDILPVISGYPKLKVLHLAYNDIHNIPPNFLTRLPELEYVNLSGNGLPSLPPLPLLPSLRCLLLHSNQLRVLPETPPLRQLHTMDLACNQFESLPKLDAFPHLKLLDLSGNTSLVINSKTADALKNVPHCLLEGVRELSGDVRAQATTKIEMGGSAKHGKWTYGSAQLIGIKSSVDCTSQLKTPTLGSTQDGVFVVMDGGRSPDAPEALRIMLGSIMAEELAYDKMEEMTGFQNVDPLQYLSHTFLTAHRQLGEIGQRYGCSVILCHLHMLENGVWILNVANTGLGEAILCRSGRAVPLTTPHSPTTNVQERGRVVDARGFISQDYRVNGVCATSRLVGCYHLWPQVVPAPSTESVELRLGDEHIILGTDSLWKFVTHEQAVHEVQSIPDPIHAARRLRDLAIAHGCHTDISVLVVRLNLFKRDALEHSLVRLKPLKTIPEPEAEAEEDENIEFTNIDDLLSDTEDDPLPSNPVRLQKLPPFLAPNVLEIDKLVLSAVTTPPSSPYSPTLQSTNIDDILSPTPLDIAIADLETSTATTVVRKPTHYNHSHPRSHLHKQPPELELKYPAQTLPRDASSSRAKSSKSGPSINAGLPISGSFEQTQSVPALNDPRRHSEGDAIDDHLALLNKALSELDAEVNPGRTRSGGKIVRRLSYVEHSYKTLTNDTYSEDTSLGYAANTLDLDEWAL